MPLEFRILGPLEADDEGRPVALGGPKQRALLAALLVRANRVVPDDRLADELWPGADPRRAARSLQVHVHRLRTALGDAGSLARDGAGYRLHVAPGHLDADRFEALARAGREQLDAGDAAGAAARLRRALALWRGPALDGIADGAALDAARRLDELRIAATEDGVDAALALGDAAGVVAELEALVAAHPRRERPWRQLMLALYRAGRQSDALAAYRRARAALRAEGLDPGPELRALEGAVLRHDPALSVEAADLRRRRHLPAPRTPLVGRRAEVAAVGRTVRGGARLVTLVGPGGVGKTRLALQAAHELADRFADGVWFADLSPIRDPELVPATIAEAVGAHEGGGRDAGAALRDWLRHREALLVADNMEQVDAAAPVLGDLLAASPRAAVLATSRTPLRLYGEHVVPVEPLALAEEAVPLFVARARAVHAGFTATPDTLPDIAEVCASLDCLPLAIELAAARAWELSPGRMREMLSERLALAAAGPRDVPERQRTLRAAIAWSRDLLAPDDRRRFARAGVFAGGFFPDAALAVLGDGGAGGLAERGLVAAHPRWEARLVMLETVRELALEALAGGGEEQAVRARHAHHYLARAEADDDGLDRLAADHDNLRLALGWFEAHDPAAMLRLAARLRLLWQIRGHLDEGRRWLEAALAAAGDRAPGPDRAEALHVLGVMRHRQGDLTGAGAAWAEAHALATALGDASGAARALAELGNTALSAGDADRAEALLQQAVAAFQGFGDDLRLSACLCSLADLALQRGDPARARELAARSAAIDDALGNHDDLAHSLNNLGRAELALGHEDAAVAHLTRGLALAGELGFSELQGYLLHAVAEVAARRGNARQAALLVGAADGRLEEIGVPLQPVEERARAATLRDLERRLGAAPVAALRAEGAGLPVADAVAIATGGHAPAR